MENNNSTEQPLVGWGEIANFLKLSIPFARRQFKEKEIRIFKFGRYTAIYPSSLKDQLEENN